MTVPDNLRDYYSSEYYSFGVRASNWKSLYYRAHFAIPHLMRLFRRCSEDLSSVISVKPTFGARILDVGCGGGRLVSILRSLGFDAYGIDPYMEGESISPYLRNSTLEEAGEGWNLIMLHHSLEHMRNNVEVLRCIRGKLAAGGVCLVRIPVATWAWEHYGTDWVQLDAPRHLVIHTLKSFQLTAELAGFEVQDIIYDSNEFQFIGSELYRRDIPLNVYHAREQFTRSDKRKFRALAEKLNGEQRGDQAAFYLRDNRPYGM